jgi:hypothetical protein
MSKLSKLQNALLRDARLMAVVHAVYAFVARFGKGMPKKRSKVERRGMMVPANNDFATYQQMPCASIHLRYSQGYNCIFASPTDEAQHASILCCDQDADKASRLVYVYARLEYYFGTSGAGSSYCMCKGLSD